jgi:hypothetical protein
MARKITLPLFPLLLTCTLVTGLALSSVAQNTPASATPNKGLPMNPLFGRKYKAGETYRYRLTLRELHNDKWAFTNIVVCELTVELDSAGVPYDVIRWISKKVLREKDTLDQTAAAISVTPYRISLDGRGRIDLPKIQVPQMTEPIQDFNTVFVAVSPELLGTADLKKLGDSFSMKSLARGDFSNGADLLKGEDCLHVTGKLTAITKASVSLYTVFMPPDTPCLTYLIKDMEIPVVRDTLNNFQMVNPAGKDLVNVGFGREFFTITSTIQKSDGKIVKAEMINLVNLKIKINCNNNYGACQMEVPLNEQRLLTLEIL